MYNVHGIDTGLYFYSLIMVNNWSRDEGISLTTYKIVYI